jgi:hypothetical protein
VYVKHFVMALALGRGLEDRARAQRARSADLRRRLLEPLPASAQAQALAGF